MAEWEKKARESRQAFAAFQVYLGLGADRSLGMVGQQCSKSVSLLARWSAKWGWVERVAAHDRHMAAVRQAAIEDAEREEARKWTERRSRLREREWSMAERLIERAEKMLDHPMTRTKDQNGAAVVPAGWRQVDIATILDMASRLGRLASEMETDRTKHDVGDFDPVEQLIRRLDGLATRLREGGAAPGDDAGRGGTPAA